MSQQKETESKGRKIKFVLGTASFGAPLVAGWTFLTADETNQAVALSKEYGVIEFDTARVYGAGVSEVVLGDAVRAAFASGTSPTPIIATKAHPMYGFTGKDIEKQLNDSLKALKSESVDIFYLHAADGKVPLEDTLAGVDRLYREKKFKEFGLSNYLPFQVAQIYYICKINGWVRPTVYQGVYSLLTRHYEEELFLLLDVFKIRFYAYSPLAGGLLIAKKKFEEKPQDGKFSFPVYQDLLWKKSIFDEVEIYSNLCDKYKLTMPDVALRWITHHSALSEERGDAIILGASKLSHIKPNLELTKGGPLPLDLVKEIDNIWIRLAKSGSNLDGQQFRTVQPSTTVEK